jgi:multiple sugar transport system substrate-binding protein
MVSDANRCHKGDIMGKSCKKWNKWKKLVLTFLVICFLTGCTTQGTSQKQPVKIVVWHYYTGIQKDAFDALVQEFNETKGQEEKIEVEAVSQVSIQNLIEALRQSEQKEVGAAELPDIFNTYADFAYESEKAGLLADLAPYMTEYEINEYVEEYIEEGRFGEKNSLKIFPIAKSTEVLMIEGTQWEEFSQKTGAKYSDLATWEGVVKTAEKYYDYTDALTPEPEDGKAFFGRDALANYIFLGSKQLGCEILRKTEDGKEQVFLDKSIMKKIWDCYYIPYIKGYFTKNGKFATDDIKTGDTIAFIGSTVSAAYFPNEVERQDGSVVTARGIALPVPNFEGTSPYCIQQGAGMSVIKSDEQHEAAAVTFLKWLTQENRNISFCADSGYLPVKEVAYDFALWEKIHSKKNSAGSPFMAEVIKTSANQMSTSSLFTSQAISCGYDIRVLLEQRLAERAKEDREIVKERIAQGMSLQQAVEAFTSKEYFETWFSSVKEEMKGLVEGE